MSAKQPEALRLAHTFDHPLPPEWSDMKAAASELRRLHRQSEVLRAERDHARACYDATVKLLVGIHALLYPAPTTLPDGRVMVFRPKSLDPHDVLQELSDRIRALPDELEKFAAIQQAEAQQPSSKEHLFELWWEAHMPNATQEQAWTAFTAAVASNGVGIAAQQPATGEPVAWIRRHPNGALSNELLTHVQVEQVRRDSGAWVPLHTHPAPSVPDGWKMVPVERSYDQRAKALIAFNRAEKDGKDRDDALQAAWDASLTAAQAQEGGECLPIRGNQVTCSRGTGGCGIQHKGGE